MYNLKKIVKCTIKKYKNIDSCLCHDFRQRTIGVLRTRYSLKVWRKIYGLQR